MNSQLPTECHNLLTVLGLCSRFTPSLFGFDALLMPYTYAFFELGLPTNSPNCSSCVRGENGCRSSNSNRRAARRSGIGPYESNPHVGVAIICTPAYSPANALRWS